MKKLYWAGVIFFLGLLAILVGGRIGKHQSIGAVGDGSYVQLDGSTATSTVLSNAVPQLVLPRNYSRSVADICSLNSNATTTWLYFQNFASGIAASTTVVVKNGYGLLPGQCYSIRGSNLFITDVWATTTVSGLLITVTEK